VRADHRFSEAVRRSGIAEERFAVMSLGTILLIILIVILLGAFPTWPYSSGWGYGPSGLVGVLLIIVIVLLLTGRL
jgi:hypothetical protein